MTDEQYQSPSRRRRLAAVAALIVLAFIAQAVVGWSLLHKAMHSDDSGWPRSSMHKLYPIGDSIWSVTMIRTTGVHSASSYYGEARHSGANGHDDPDEFWSVTPKWLQRRLIQGGAVEVDPLQPHNSARLFVACGWPMVSLVCVGTHMRPEGEHIVQGGLTVERDNPSPVRSEPLRYYYPYRPLMFGTIVNTALFAVLLAVPFVAALGGRRLWRYERGRCPRCAYDLQQDFKSGCPECGWGRPDAQFSPAN